MSRTETVAFLRRSCLSYNHPVGTCAMGSGREAVVNAELRVRGASGLRIADASVMPTIPSANTQAAVVMIAEFASRLIVAALAGVSSAGPRSSSVWSPPAARPPQIVARLPALRRSAALGQGPEPSRRPPAKPGEVRSGREPIGGNELLGHKSWRRRRLRKFVSRTLRTGGGPGAVNERPRRARGAERSPDPAIAYPQSLFCPCCPIASHPWTISLQFSPWPPLRADGLRANPSRAYPPKSHPERCFCNKPRSGDRVKSLS
jgi:hypothetical protein